MRNLLKETSPEIKSASASCLSFRHTHSFQTNLLGLPDVADEKQPGEPAALTALRDKLDAAIRSRRDWKTFGKALQTGTEDLLKNKDRLAATDHNYPWIDLAEARSEGIMPIPYLAAP